jgi:hypothetical protein
MKVIGSLLILCLCFILDSSVLDGIKKSGFLDKFKS